MILLLVPAAEGKRAESSCGTYPQRLAEEILAHRIGVAERRNLKNWRALNGLAATEDTRGASQDVGEIAVLEEDAGIVSRRNLFNLEGRTLRFTPGSGGYRVQNVTGDYSDAEQQGGTVVAALGDDDTREFTLGFEFSFFGKSYRRLFLNSDGNLTFEGGDVSTRERSLGRLLSGLPRIGAFFGDLDPNRAGSVHVLSRPDRLVATWLAVPEYSDFGIGPRSTFQVRLLANGTIEFAYQNVSSSEAIVGIAPGMLVGGSTIVSFAALTGGETFPAAVAERFRALEEIDTVTVAQRFFETHDDAYDYLAIYNALGITPGPGVVAFEVTVRNNRTGYGDTEVEAGTEYGSPRRLQAVLNMGQITQYPRDPNGILPSRATARDTPTTVLAHEAGHLFLAFASVRDPNNPTVPPFLGRQSAHWAFTFNSEASLLEGNRIQDKGPGVSPRFETVAVTEQYSPLDQYLMGLRPKEEVGGLFYVTASGIGGFFPPAPQVGRTFDGVRNDVTVDDLIAVHGRRTPDHTVSQRRFRFGIVLIAPRGVSLDPAWVEQVEAYRQSFQSFYNRATGERALADTTLRKRLDLSVWPAAGVVNGRETTVTLRISKAQAAGLNVALRYRNGVAAGPAAVTIPAGQTAVSFALRGARAGVEELTATAADAAFEMAEARVQVLEAASGLRVRVVSGDRQTATSGFLAEPVVVRVEDENRLPYPSVRVTGVAAGNGALESASVLTDEQGLASFRWRPGAAPNNRLRLSVEGGPSVEATAAGNPFFTSSSVGNAASFSQGITPLALHTMFGANLNSRSVAAPFPWPLSLDGLTVKVNGREQPLVFLSETQLNFYFADPVAGTEATVEVTTPLGTSGVVRVPVRRLSPGIFFDTASGEGATIRNGNTLEIYATGLGAVTQREGFQVADERVEALWNGVAIPVGYAGMAPGYVGLYQVNATLPAGAAGTNRLRLRVGGVDSNEVRVILR